jgi:Family of unknown function (DUF6159)
MDPPQAPPQTIGRPASWDGRIARGFRLARVSWDVLSHDRRLLALLAALCALAAVLATGILARRLHAAPDSVRVIAPVWIAAYLVSFTTIFCNVALVHVVARRWHGEPVGIADGIAAAGRRVGAIAGWSMLTTTVGLALQLLERLTLGISQLVGGAIAAVFVWIVSVALTQVFTLAVFQHATGGPCCHGFSAADLERPRDPRALRLLRRLRRGGAS